jgi:hypothetical protein
MNLDSTWMERARVALNGEWMPGMRVINPRFGDARIVVVEPVTEAYFVFKEVRGVEGYRDPRDDEPSDVPDLADEPTVLCLVAIGRRRLRAREGAKTVRQAQSNASHRLRDALIAWSDGGRLGDLADVAVEVLEATR